MQQAVRCLGIQGRAAMVALSRESMSLLPYPELISKEAEVIGVSDHLAIGIPGLNGPRAQRKTLFLRKERSVSSLWMPPKSTPRWTSREIQLITSEQ